MGLNEAKAGVFRRAPAFQGLYPKSKPPAMRVVMILGTRPGAVRHTCVESDAVEMLKHSNRRSRLSFFNIEMMEIL